MDREEQKIQILAPQEARRIAAGEVVDRPAALVREFLDNAIDASSLDETSSDETFANAPSANIEVSIEEGGCKKIEVSDDGAGMSYGDLELCWHTHATSKISSLDDLDTAVTLGFRGEALAAAASVSRLEIITSTDGREAFRLETGPGEDYPPKIEQTRRTKGTTVRALNLFESIPARKRFLKREGSEGTLCRQAFIDKVLPFNKINFRYIQDGKLKDFFPAISTKKERFAAAILSTDESYYLHEIYATGSGFSVTIVIGGPELYRTDRRQLFVFANGRRINDYSLIQALEYGSQGWFPNGTHPIGAVYIEIDPSLADFNIHPAKREVRFRDPGTIHHTVSGTVKSFFHNLFLKNSRREDLEFSSRGDAETSNHRFAGTQREELEFNSRRDAGTSNLRFARTQRENLGFSTNNNFTKVSSDWFDRLSNNNLYHSSSAPPRLREINCETDVKYAGRVFNLFILIEWGDKLCIVDQHAAHERILYNRFLEEPVPKQELLAPIPFCTESDDEDTFLQAKRNELSRLGVDIIKDANSSKGEWRIEALPSNWQLGDMETVKKILELQSAGENMTQKWAAALCCHAAIKDGDYPDDETAFALAKEALGLPDPHCPHGRPIWTEISKEALYKAVRRN